MVMFYRVQSGVYGVIFREIWTPFAIISLQSNKATCYLVITDFNAIRNAFDNFTLGLKG